MRIFGGALALLQQTPHDIMAGPSTHRNIALCRIQQRIKDLLRIRLRTCSYGEFIPVVVVSLCQLFKALDNGNMFIIEAVSKVRFLIYKCSG